MKKLFVLISIIIFTGFSYLIYINFENSNKIRDNRFNTLENKHKLLKKEFNTLKDNIVAYKLKTNLSKISSMEEMLKQKSNDYNEKKESDCKDKNSCINFNQLLEDIQNLKNKYIHLHDHQINSEKQLKKLEKKVNNHIYRKQNKKKVTRQTIYIDCLDLNQRYKNNCLTERKRREKNRIVIFYDEIESKNCREVKKQLSLCHD